MLEKIYYQEGVWFQHYTCLSYQLKPSAVQPVGYAPYWLAHVLCVMLQMCDFADSVIATPPALSEPATPSPFLSGLLPFAAPSRQPRSQSPSPKVK